MVYSPVVDFLLVGGDIQMRKLRLAVAIELGCP